MGGVKAGSQHLFAVGTRDTLHRKPVRDQGLCMARTLRTSTERVVLAEKLLPWHPRLGT